jgi:hypothetical protein
MSYELEIRPLHGLMAEFATPEALVAAAGAARRAGYRRMDAYSPFPIEDLPEALGTKPSKLPLAVLLGGLAGGIGAYAMQYYSAVIDYAWNIGARPLHSWPAFIPVTFELTILGAALTAVFGMLISSRLPHPYHPVFNDPHFGRASRDRFFLCIEATDEKFSLTETRVFLAGLSPLGVREVDG